MESLLTYISDIYSLNTQAQSALGDALKAKEYLKGTYILKEGSTSRNLYFLETGCIRGFYRLEDKEITHWFGFENDFVTSFHSFITQRPAVENLQALEDSVLWGISYEALYKLYDEFPEIERLGRMACEKYYIRLEERYINSQFKTAAERYMQLLESNGEFLQRIPLGHIASYLGISQETLSRIRSKKL